MFVAHVSAICMQVLANFSVDIQVHTNLYGLSALIVFFFTILQARIRNEKRVALLGGSVIPRTQWKRTQASLAVSFRGTKISIIFVLTVVNFQRLN
jgi:hypothetical protein